MNPLTLAPAVIAGIGGKNAQRQAQSLNDRALSMQEDYYGIFRKVFENAAEMSQTAVKNVLTNMDEGLYDADTLVHRMEEDDARVQAVRSGNYAAGARIMGYKPGDSEPMLQMGEIDKQHKEFRDKEATRLRVEAPARLNRDLAGAIGIGQQGASIGGAVTNSAAGAMQQRAGQIEANAPNPTALLPYLINSVQMAGNQTGGQLASMAPATNQLVTSNFNQEQMIGNLPAQGHWSTYDKPLALGGG